MGRWIGGWGEKGGENNGIYASRKTCAIMRCFASCFSIGSTVVTPRGRIRFLGFGICVKERGGINALNINEDEIKNTSAPLSIYNILSIPLCSLLAIPDFIEPKKYKEIVLITKILNSTTHFIFVLLSSHITFNIHRI